MYSQTEEEEKKINFKKICEETSLHGWKFIYFKNSKPCHAAFWIMIIFSALVLSGIIIRNYVIEFIDSTVVYNIKSPTVDLSNVFFPSLVVCNLNILRRSFIISLLNETKINQNIDFVQLHSLINNFFLSGGNSELSVNDQDIIDSIINSEIYLKQYDEFVSTNEIEEPTGYSDVPVFHWHSIQDVADNERQLKKYKTIYLPEIASQFRPSDIFLSIKFDTGFGINHDGGGFSTDVSDTCHWLTPFVKEPEDPYDLLTNKPFSRNGMNNGLELLLDAEVYDYALSKSGIEGFTLSILHHLDIPIMKNIGVNVLPGQSNQLAITVKLMNTTHHLRERFTPEERQCYFEEELNLKHLPASNSFRYDMSNCLFEATLQQIEKECNCVPRYFSDVVPEIDVCQGQKTLCMKKLLDVMGDYRTVLENGIKKVCLANCIDQKYDVRVTSAAYANKLAYVQSPEFCQVYDKVMKSCQTEKKFTLEESYPNICSLLMNSSCTKAQQQSTSTISKLLTQYARENIAKVSVYLKDPFVEEIIREEKITLIQFIGSVGGLLGLFMGLSFISLVEIFYMLFEWLFNKVQKWFDIKNFVQVESQTTNTSRHRSKTNNNKVSGFLESIINSENK